MGIFSSYSNNRNDDYADQNGVNSSDHFGDANMDTRSSFSGYNHRNTYGSNSVKASTAVGQGVFGRDHSAELGNQPKNNNAAGNSGIMKHDLNVPGRP
jgi:hypothetical protein